MEKLLLLALAGALGTLSRYGLSSLVHRFNTSAFPLETFAVNMLGSFLFGLVWSFFAERLALPQGARLIVLTGFMGAFTTFSTYMFESLTLIQGNQIFWALCNIAGQIILGLLCMGAGLFLGKVIAF